MIFFFNLKRTELILVLNVSGGIQVHNESFG